MADVPQLLPVEFGQEYRVKLGKSFTFPRENAFHTIKYDFKPLSLDQGQPGRLRMSEGDEVAVSLPMVQAESSTEGAQVYFKGSRKPCTKECILIINAKTGEATLEKISDAVQLKVVRDGTERARSTKLLRDHSVSPIPAQQQQQQKQVPPMKGPTVAPATNQTAPSSSTPQPSERQTPTLQITPKAPKKVKSATKSPHQAPNKRKAEATAVSTSVAASVATAPPAVAVPAVSLSLPSLMVQAPTPITPSPVHPFPFSGTAPGIPTKKIKRSSSSTSDSSSSSDSSSEGDSDSDALMSELQGEQASSSTQVIGLPMEVNQPSTHCAASDPSGGGISSGLPVVNPTNGQAARPTTATPTTTTTTSQSSGLLPATLQMPVPAPTVATAGGGQLAGKMPTPQDNAVIGIMSSESGNSSSSNSGSSSSDSSDSSDENDNEVANAFGYPSAPPPPQRTISQLRTDLELSESGSDSEP